MNVGHTEAAAESEVTLTHVNVRSEGQPAASGVSSCTCCWYVQQEHVKTADRL